jgi:hypothetical protein
MESWQIAAGAAIVVIGGLVAYSVLGGSTVTNSPGGIPGTPDPTNGGSTTSSNTPSTILPNTGSTFSSSALTTYNSLTSGQQLVSIGGASGIISSGQTASYGGITITNATPNTAPSGGNSAIITYSPQSAANTISVNNGLVTGGGIAAAGAVPGSQAAQGLALLLSGQQGSPAWNNLYGLSHP